MFGFVLAGTHKLSLADARKLAADCATQFLQSIQNSDKAKAYAAKVDKTFRRTRPDGTFSSKDFIFRLSFWDENIDRRENPYIAEIRFFDNTFQYFTSDEGQRLVPVFQETFDEATKLMA